MFKIAILFLITFSQLNGLNNESIIGPSKHFTASLNVDLNGIKNATNFKVLVPRNHGYKFEIKEPYPLVPGQSISRVRLHYFDKSGQKYIFGLEEHKATGYKIKRDVTTIDARNQKRTTNTIIEEFRFDLSGEKVNINRSEGRFVRWADDTPGGYLRFVQDDTYIQIDSSEMSKQKMIDLARSMKRLN